MKERPILFSTPMVKAILAGHKTMTRRVVKQQPTNPPFSAKFDDDGFLWWELNARGNWLTSWQKCPYGMPGDRLWVRETWCVGSKHNFTTPRDLPVRKMSVIYKSGGSCSNAPSGRWECDTWPAEGNIPDWSGPMRPSIFMPRWASRITLEIVCTRVERLQNISSEDAKHEGFEPCYYGGAVSAVEPFAVAWDRSYKKRGYSWSANPWVWVVSFRMIDALANKETSSNEVSLGD